MIQVRNVPDHVHRVLKARAALQGTSLSELILEELERMATLPSAQELRERLRRAEGFDLQTSSATMIREEREAS
jgi:plasmid stability protein